MSDSKIKGLIVQLQEELNKTNVELDAKTSEQLQDLDVQLSQLYGDNNELQSDVYEGLRDMEYDFLAKHPVVSNLVREVIDILSKAGI